MTTMNEVCFTDSMSKQIYNRSKLYANEQLRLCFSCFNPLFSVVQLLNYTKAIIVLRLSECCRIIHTSNYLEYREYSSCSIFLC